MTTENLSASPTNENPAVEGRSIEQLLDDVVDAAREEITALLRGKSVSSDRYFAARQALQTRIADLAASETELKVRTESQREAFAEVERLRSELETASRRISGLSALAILGAKVLESARSDIGTDVDGGDVQDWAVASGALIEVTASESCGEDCRCAEWDDFPQPCMRIPDEIASLVDELTAENSASTNQGATKENR